MIYRWRSQRQGFQVLSKSVLGLNKEKKYLSIYYSRVDNALIVDTSMQLHDESFDDILKVRLAEYKRYILRLRHAYQEFEYYNKVLSFIQSLSTAQ